MKNTIFSLNLVVFIGLFAFCAASAQQPTAAGNVAKELAQTAPPRPLMKRGGLLQLLDLSIDQIRQIRQINRDTREATRAANQRQRQARRRLDAAIYQDAPDSAQVEQFARELADAQAEATKLRANVELQIRRVLTPEQIVRFRQLRAPLADKLPPRE